MAFMRFKSLPATLFLLFACLLPICVLFLQVTITPEVASRTVNRAIMAELVRLYKESDLGMRLPAYDGRKSLYTAGELPFVWKEFKIKLVDELDGINGPKYVFFFAFACSFYISLYSFIFFSTILVFPLLVG